MRQRRYDNDYPSVTEILDVLRKIGLEMWFKLNTIQFINEESKKGKLIGTQIHDVIENFINNGDAKILTDYPDQVTNALKSFMLFKKENPEFLFKLSEMPLTSLNHKFNGKIDCIGENIIFDWKTGTCKEKDRPEIYDEYKYQVSAYVYLYNEVKNANIEKAIIVTVAKDKIAYNLCVMEKDEIDACFNEVFLPCLKIINYKRRQKNDYVQPRHESGTSAEKKDVVTAGLAGI